MTTTQTTINGTEYTLITDLEVFKFTGQRFQITENIYIKLSGFGIRRTSTGQFVNLGERIDQSGKIGSKGALIPTSYRLKRVAKEIAEMGIIDDGSPFLDVEV